MTHTTTTLALGWDPDDMLEFSICLDEDDALVVSVAHGEQEPMSVQVEASDLDALAQAIQRTKAMMGQR